jgi:uncharacterized membrane protein
MIYWASKTLSIMALSVLMAVTAPLIARAQEVVDTYYTATVEEVTPKPAEDGTPTDTVEVRLNREGQSSTTAFWSDAQDNPRTFAVKKDDKLIIRCTTIEGTETCEILSQVRLWPLVMLLALFATIIMAITRKQGVRSLAAMVLGGAVIMLVIVPLLLKGVSPLLVTIVGGVAILFPTIYLSHGFEAKSHIALVSIVVMVILIGLVSMGFTDWLNLMGTGSEEAMYLTSELNLRSILISAMILGALGVIDDLAVTQIEIVSELHHSNPKLSVASLIRRALHIGQSHIASVINTLFLAYAGVSLPLLLLIDQVGVPWWVAVQQEQIATEIMRTAVGTIGLILVVPLATYLAALVVHRRPEWFPLKPHHHHH